MTIGFLYEPAYWLLLEKLIRDLEYEVDRLGEQSCRVTATALDSADVDVVYVLPCEELEMLRRVESQRIVINSTRAQEIAIDKIATSEILMEDDLPTPETVISQTPDAVLEMLDRFGIVLLKSTDLCGGAGHRILRRRNGKITTRARHRTYHVTFGEHNRILEDTIVLGPPYYAQQFIGTPEHTNDRVYRMYIVGNQVVMGTARVKAGVDTPEKSIINVATGARYEFLETLDGEMVRLSLRAAYLIGFDTGVVDFLQDRSGHPLIIEADCDGCYLFICRKFQEATGYSEAYNFNACIARHLVSIARGAPHVSRLRACLKRVSEDDILWV